MRRFVVSGNAPREGLSRDRRRGFFQSHSIPLSYRTLLCLLVLFVPFQVSGATSAPFVAVGAVQLSGRVVDSVTGAPVAAATVRLQAGARIAAADAEGRFSFGALLAGEYSLEISAVGYRSRRVDRIEVTDDQPRSVVVGLAPISCALPEGRTVTARRLQPDADGVIRIDRAAIEAAQVSSMPELLAQVPGVYVQQQGPGGPATVRMRGADPKQVLVLVDGVKLNAGGSGVADLSSVPLGAVESIAIHTGGGSAEFGPEALAGTVEISTRPRAVEDDSGSNLALAAGRWARREYRVGGHNPLPVTGLEMRLGAERVASDGDFDYEYAADGVTRQSDTVFSGRRINNDVQSTSGYAVGLQKLSETAEVSFSVQRFKAERGLPGTVEQPDSTGRSEDSRLLVTAAVNSELSSRHRLAFSLGFTQLKQGFESLDPNAHAASHFDTRFLNEIVSMKQQYRLRGWRRFDLNTVIEARRERFFHDDLMRPRFSMGRADRDAFGASLSARQGVDIGRSKVFELATLEAAVRYDVAETKNDRAATVITPAGQSHVTRSWSPRIGLSLANRGAWRYSVRASYGKSLRLPELNALFWRGDARSVGNPDLRPEQSEHSEVEISGGKEIGPVTLTAGATYFHASVTDLVVWQPNFQGAWQPQNVGRAQITGHEVKVGLYAFGDLLSMHYQRSITEALNKQSLHTVNGKQLPFYPETMSSLSVELRYAWFEAAVQYRRADRTYTNEANTKSYAPYAVTDVRVAATIPIGRHWRATVRSAVENLTDEQYVLSAQYPMPGRQVLVGLNIIFAVGGSTADGE